MYPKPTHPSKSQFSLAYPPLSPIPSSTSEASRAFTYYAGHTRVSHHATLLLVMPDPLPCPASRTTHPKSLRATPATLSSILPHPSLLFAPPHLPGRPRYWSTTPGSSRSGLLPAACASAITPHLSADPTPAFKFTPALPLPLHAFIPTRPYCLRTSRQPASH